MARFFFFLSILLISLTGRLDAQNRISFKSWPETTENLEFYTLDFPFFDFRNISGRVGTGQSLELQGITSTSCVYFEFGPFLCYFYAEPGKNYEIEFPDLKGISLEWQDNPFFSREGYHVKIWLEGSTEGGNELNHLIREFDRNFDPFLEEQILRYYDPEFSKIKRDSFLQIHYNQKSVSEPEFYREYIQYKKAILEFSCSDYDHDELAAKYLYGNRIDFGNPACREFFGLLFQKHFEYLARKKEFSELPSLFGSFSTDELLSLLRKDQIMQNDTLLSLILYHESYMAYYSGYFDKAKIRAFVESLSRSFGTTGLEDLGAYLQKKFTSMEPGFPVYFFQRVNYRGDTLSVDDQQTSYNYLAFIDDQAFTSMRELEYLKFVYLRFDKCLDIKCFIVTDEPERVKEIVELNDLKWPVMAIGKNDSIISEYQVKALPVFFLIDKNGTLIKNPAPAPSENFEQSFIEFLRYRKEF